MAAVGRSFKNTASNALLSLQLLLLVILCHSYHVYVASLPPLHVAQTSNASDQRFWKQQLCAFMLTIFMATGVAILIVYVLFRLSSVLKTMMEDTSPYVLTKEDLAINGEPSIPKILHQVYLGYDGTPMPEHWKEPQKSCIDLHPDRTYRVS